jgi:hypothetical protein
MSKRKALADRVARAAGAALAAQGYVSPVDVVTGIGWLDAGTMERWRRGQIDCIESAVQTSLPRILEALTLLQSWATERGLSPNQADYVARTPQRQTLRFSRSGEPAIEARYRTPLGFAKASGEEARTPDRAGEPRSRAGCGRATEERMGVPPLRQQRRLSDDGKSRSRLPAMYGSR